MYIIKTIRIVLLVVSHNESNVLAFGYCYYYSINTGRNHTYLKLFNIHRICTIYEIADVQ